MEQINAVLPVLEHSPCIMSGILTEPRLFNEDITRGSFAPTHTSPPAKSTTLPHVFYLLLRWKDDDHALSAPLIFDQDHVHNNRLQRALVSFQTLLSTTIPFTAIVYELNIHIHYSKYVLK